MTRPAPARTCLIAATAALALLGSRAHAQSIDALLPVCAPLVHPVTMGKIISVESNGRPYALADAGPKGLPWKGVREKMVRSYFPPTIDEAEAIAKRLIAANHIVALGLSQVSSQNLARLGLTVRQVLDPCTNLRAGSQILAEFYLNARKKEPDDQKAILAAVSAYNSGSFVNGFTNGYVSKVVAAKSFSVPSLHPAYASQLAGLNYSTPTEASNTMAYSPPPRMLSQKISVLRVTRDDEE